MKRTIWIVALAAFIIIGIGVASAAMWNNAGQAQKGFGVQPNQNVQKGTYHDQMEKILEEGSFADLVALRAETGMPLNPRIQSEEDFKLWQDRHEAMEQYWEENGIEPGNRGMHNGQGMGQGKGLGKGQNNGNCPMMDG
jgi:hypothetical protein